MSGIEQVVIGNAAMTAAVAVMQAAQQMSANAVGLLAGAVNTGDQRAPLAYSRMLDKLA